MCGVVAHYTGYQWAETDRVPISHSSSQASDLLPHGGLP
jgi:hypothetical protein